MINGRERELVIVSPGIEQAPEKMSQVDPLKHCAFWTGYGWSGEYPNALNWGGDDPYEEFPTDDPDYDYDEDAYEEYLEEALAAARKELRNPAIPAGSQILEAVGYAERALYTKRS